jgi:Protein of unknown function (DUF1572)
LQHLLFGWWIGIPSPYLSPPYLSQLSCRRISLTGPKMPADMNAGMEKTVKSKAEVIIRWKRSLEAVRQAHWAETPKDLGRKVHIADRDSTLDWMYLRIIIHANEHMGQLVAYARMTGVVPPWASRPGPTGGRCFPSSAGINLLVKAFPMHYGSGYRR